jgi:hypothetical protein
MKARWGKMDDKISVSISGFLNFSHESRESIADWRREKEVNANLFIQRVAELMDEYYIKDSKEK